MEREPDGPRYRLRLGTLMLLVAIVGLSLALANGRLAVATAWAEDLARKPQEVEEDAARRPSAELPAGRQ